MSPLLNHDPAARQRGAALFVVVIVSLIVTLMGVQLVNRLVFGQRSTLFESDLAFARENAEAALRDAEQDVSCNQWDNSQGGYVFVANAGRASNQTRPHCDIKATNAAQNGSAGGSLGTCNNGYLTVILDDPTTVPSRTVRDACRTNLGAITKAPAVEFGNFIAFSLPYYTVEVLLVPNGQVGQNIPYYRIRATGVGRNKSTVVTLESIFRPL